MIKIICKDKLVYHKIFEFMSMSFPSYLGENSLCLKLDLEKNKAVFKNLKIEKSFDLNIDKSDLINSIKRSIYSALSNDMENKDWGILTGMRPSKLARKLLNGAESYASCKNILKKKYLISDKKLDLLMDVVEVENNILKNIRKDSYSIYIHIPFCKSICSYCSFRTMLARKDRIDLYLDRLAKDIKREAKFLKNKPNSIYIGGGTPTAIGNENLKKLLALVADNFQEALEYTVECGRTDTFDQETLEILKEYGVNRISINPQTANIKTSQVINRPIDLADIEKKFYMAKSIGIDSINMDLIIGLPNENISDIKNSINVFSNLNPENITMHNLSLKKGSKLLEANYSFEDDLEGILSYSKNYLQEKGYYPYYLYRQKRILNNAENIGYTKKGYESLYNILIIEEFEDIIAFGMGSASKFIQKDGSIKQVINFKNLRDYLNGSDQVFSKKIDYYKLKEE